MLSVRGGVVHLPDPVSPEALDKAKAYIDVNLENYVASFIENMGSNQTDPEAIDARLQGTDPGPDAPLELLDKMVDDDKLGLKSGEGFYRWENGQPQL